MPPSSSIFLRMSDIVFREASQSRQTQFIGWLELSGSGNTSEASRKTMSDILKKIEEEGASRLFHIRLRRRSACWTCKKDEHQAGVAREWVHRIDAGSARESELRRSVTLRGTGSIGMWWPRQQENRSERALTASHRSIGVMRTRLRTSAWAPLGLGWLNQRCRPEASSVRAEE